MALATADLTSSIQTMTRASALPADIPMPQAKTTKTKVMKMVGVVALVAPVMMAKTQAAPAPIAQTLPEVVCLAARMALGRMLKADTGVKVTHFIVEAARVKPQKSVKKTQPGRKEPFWVASCMATATTSPRSAKRMKKRATIALFKQNHLLSR